MFAGEESLRLRDMIEMHNIYPCIFFSTKRYSIFVRYFLPFSQNKAQAKPDQTEEKRN